MKVQFAATVFEQDAQLREWGLTREPLVEAVLFARTFYNDCTALDPHGFNHSIAYARAGRRLRERLIPTQQWVRDDINNQTAVRNDALRLRLYPCNFDDATADKHRMPTNLSAKGNAAREDVARNPDLFGGTLEHLVPRPVPETVRGYTTLVLGMNFEGEFAKAEVSVPVRFLDGSYTAFGVRVPILDGTGPDGAARTNRDDDGGVFGEVDIPIKVVL